MRAQASALVVEDNQAMRTLLRQMLLGAGLESVDAVASIAEARSHLDCLAYDVMLVDVGLARENGLDLVASIRLDQSHPQRKLPVIVVSGQNQRAVVTAAREAGADAFIAKPVSLDALSARVEKLLSQPAHYIETESYFGPDRRRGRDTFYRGPERRRRTSEDVALI